MTEAGIIGSHCGRHRGVHLFEDQAIVEVVDEHDRPAPAGQTGHKLLVTNLIMRTPSRCCATRSPTWSRWPANPAPAAARSGRDIAGKFKLIESRLRQPVPARR
jgi:hypothetical protein